MSKGEEGGPIHALLVMIDTREPETTRDPIGQCNAKNVSSMPSKLIRLCSSMVRMVEQVSHRNYPSTSPYANT